MGRWRVTVAVSRELESGEMYYVLRPTPGLGVSVLMCSYVAGADE